MIKTLELKISPNHIEDQDYIIKKIAESVGFSPNSIFGYRILKNLSMPEKNRYTI